VEDTIPNATNDLKGYHKQDGFAEKLVFGDEAMFHVCSKVNHHNVHIWGIENRHAILEHIRDSHKVNVFLLFPFAKSMDHFSLQSQALWVPWCLLHKQTWRDSLPIDMLLSAVSVLVVVLLGSEVPEQLNYLVYSEDHQEKLGSHKWTVGSQSWQFSI
jgi:hypothetical protein